ncbi:tRNA (adenosine(37)-N6)-threonylcarbamoyltransferase complex ATPase subunit type 1 TsaE [Halovulum marinum]|uniref:tRNA (adenosine(37)-N6)-threonylcarbamoyltransferase complex ATPase subunit type 1 TsaE n=1 Tax=Halovulum marinum TaxID=2662447 RepID=UPI002D7666FC|nr:tRNA (adenosine(37)-N6)-threonylcarbamoyltransferase complex ATPase subunit type 1 TsaE [Halovulum marinum]
MDRTRTLRSQAETESLAAALALALAPGDAVLLSGPVGAGKSAFARAAIRARQASTGLTPEEVPSPSYTLVQAYDAGGVEIWHADLYRLSDPDELVELGLDEAFTRAIVFLEWPERLGEAAPARALRLDLRPDPAADDVRQLRVRAAGGGWDAALAALAMADAA